MASQGERFLMKADESLSQLSRVCLLSSGGVELHDSLFILSSGFSELKEAWLSQNVQQRVLENQGPPKTSHLPGECTFHHSWHVQDLNTQ